MSGQGHGKLILLGEHAVVWGCPAIAASLGAGASAMIRGESTNSRGEIRVFEQDRPETPLFTTAPDPDGVAPIERAMSVLMGHFPIDTPLDIDVTLAIPPGAGLGSSAALAVAIAHALDDFASDGTRDKAATASSVEDAVAASEAIFHGNASGIDQAAAMGRGLFRFERGDGGATITPLDLPGFDVLVCQAAPGASTAKMVSGVGSRRLRNPTSVGLLGEAIEQLVEDAIDAIGAKDLERLGELCDINHGILSSFGVSTRAIDVACHIAREAGAYGAKLTGAGGGGCVFAVADPKHREAILDAWRTHDPQLRCFATTLGVPTGP